MDVIKFFRERYKCEPSIYNIDVELSKEIISKLTKKMSLVHFEKSVNDELFYKNKIMLYEYDSLGILIYFELDFDDKYFCKIYTNPGLYSGCEFLINNILKNNNGN